MDDVSGEQQEIEPSAKQDRRESPEYWFRWLRAAKTAAKPHWNDAAAAWKEYENKGKIQVENSIEEIAPLVYPIYWSSCKTLEPAYYSRTPKIASSRLWDIDDTVALTGSLIIDRLGEYLAEHGDFDDTMHSVVGQFIHADKAAAQLVYTLKERAEKRSVPVRAVPLEDGAVGYVDSNGQPVEGEVIDAPDGSIYAEVEVRIIEKQEIRVSPVLYDEVLHTPTAKSQADITEIAIKFCMDEDEATARFGTDVDGNARSLPWKTNKDYERDDEDKERTDLPGRYLEGWECWCLHTKKVYWVSEDYKEGFLDAQEDPYKLRKFFPVTPFIFGSKPSKDLYPTPVYMQVKPTIDQLHRMFGRLFDNLESIRRRALVDGSLDDVIAALNSGDQEFVAVQNFELIKDKGGIEQLIHFIPVREFVAALGELAQLEDKFKNLFYEWFGVPDIMRGAADPIETAAGLEIKSGSANDRFKWMKKQVSRTAKDALEMMVDLALQVFDDERIAQICGYQFLTPQHQQRFGPALAFVRNDPERIVRVDIETDSTSFSDDTIKLQQQNQVSQTVINGLATIGGMQNPEFAGTALRVLLKTLAAMPGGSKDFEDGIRAEVKAITDKKNQPEGPPQPDAAMLKVQVEQQRLQLDSTVKMRELDQKDFKLQLEAQKQNFEAQIKQLAYELDRQVQSLLGALEQQRVQLAERAEDRAAQEMVAEESRLAFEAEANATRQPQEQQSQPAASITIVNAPQEKPLPPIL